MEWNWALLPILHNGPHNSPDDLTLSDWIIVVLALAALVGIGYGLWHAASRKR